MLSFITWNWLRGFGESRAIKTSYIWLFVVPIAARMLATLESPLLFRIFNADLKIAIDLPFSWKIFYFSAVAFSAASITYSFFCPPIVKNHPTLRHFLDEGRWVNQLAEYFGGMVEYEAEEGSVEGNIWTQISSMIPDSSFEIQPRKNLEQSVGSTFWQLWNFANEGSVRVGARIFCAVSYGIGFILIGIVMVQNLVSVIRQLS